MRNDCKTDKFQNFKNISDLNIGHLKQSRLDKLELKAATCNSAYNKLLNCE